MIRGAIISAAVSVALFALSGWLVRPGKPLAPLLDVPISVADDRRVTQTFVVPDAEQYGIAVWFPKSEAHLEDPISLSWTLSHGDVLVAQGSKDKLYTSWGDQVGSELWSGSPSPGPYTLQVDVAGAGQTLRSASPRLIVQLHDSAVGPPVNLIASAVARLAGAAAAFVGICFLVAWGIGKWQLVST